MTAIYTATITAIGGRDGRATSPDGKIDFKLARPATADEGVNPEQLFAAGYAACFGGAVQYLATQKGLSIGPAEIKADVTLNKNDTGFFLSVTLSATVSGIDDAAAIDLIKAAHDFCPYSKATRGNITVALTANGKAVS